MLISYDHALTSAARDSFLHSNAHKSHPRATLRSPILQAWKQARAMGLPPDNLPTPVTGKPRPRLASTHLFPGPPFAECAGNLTAMGGLILLLHTDLSPCVAEGDAHLARLLGQCSFSLDHMGVTAASLAQKTDEAWVIGAEHYLDCLQDYATYAWQSEEVYSRYVTCVVLPRQIFTDSLLHMLRYFRRACQYRAELMRVQMDLTRQKELFNQLKDLQDDALMLVDYSQKIICVNKPFEHCFDLSQADVISHDLTEILPELESMVSCMRTGKSIHQNEINFEGLPRSKRTLFVSCSPWKQNGIINGMVFSFTTSRQFFTPTKKTDDSLKQDLVLDSLIGNSALFTEVKRMARSVADSNSSIILTGESGTGKELFARALHNDSARAGKPFVAVNCSAIPKELIGSELFGYSDGAFTGARKGGAMGKFEYATGGTLLLDEIGELPLDVQAILLRVLEERSIVRIGDNKVIPVDVRIISATNRNLLQMIEEKSFRLDLYYRLNVINLELPPLRYRREDIPLLATHFMESLSQSLNKDVIHISQEAMDCLVQHDWPGNIRHLRNAIERGVNMSEGPTIRLEDLPLEITSSRLPPRDLPSPSQPVMQEHRIESRPEANESYEDWERRRIWELMQQHRANKSRIAEEMGMSRGTLYKRMQRYGL